MKKRQLLKILTATILIISLSYAGMAQSGTKDGKEKESKTAIWEAEANSLCTTYDLQKKAAAKLSKAYVKIREEVAEQNNEVSKRNEEEAYKANALKNMELGKAKLKTEINKVLKDEQANEALLVMGSFSSRWDSYQKALLDLNLEKEQLAVASSSLTNYIKVYLKARKIAADAGDRFSGRTATELKSNLDKALSKSLDENQMQKWAIATQRKKNSN